MGDAFKDAGPGERSVYDRTGLPEVAAIARHLAPGDDLVERATAALEGVTEGPWEAVYNRQTWGWVEVDGPSFKIGAPTQATDLSLADEVQRKKDARFIAFARQWVPEAAARISALTATVAELQASLADGSFYKESDIDALQNDSATLRDRLARMEGAAEWQDKQRRDAFARRHLSAPEDPHVYVLCERYGYGAVMDAASRLWARKDSMGAFYIGGCIGIKPGDTEDRSRS